MKIDKMICDKCRMEIKSPSKTREVFVNITFTDDDRLDLCHSCYVKLKRWLKE